MSKILCAFCLMLAACTMGGARIDRETAPRADRMFKVIRDELGALASVDVRLCVAPDGRVQTVDLLRGSSLAACQPVWAGAHSRACDTAGRGHVTSQPTVASRGFGELLSPGGGTRRGTLHPREKGGSRKEEPCRSFSLRCV